MTRPRAGAAAPAAKGGRDAGGRARIELPTSPPAPGATTREMLALLVADLEALEADVRRQADRIAGREEAQLLHRLADGLERPLAALCP